MAEKKTLSKLIRGVPDTPSRMAFAFALGVLLGILPGTGAIVAAGVATALRLSIPLAVAGALVTNPLTAPLVYAGSFFLGRWILGDQVAEQLLIRIGLTTLVGNVILAFAMAVAGYFLVWSLAVWHQSKKRCHASGH